MFQFLLSGATETTEAVEPVPATAEAFNVRAWSPEQVDPVIATASVPDPASADNSGNVTLNPIVATAGIFDINPFNRARVTPVIATAVVVVAPIYASIVRPDPVIATASVTTLPVVQVVLPDPVIATASVPSVRVSESGARYTKIRTIPSYRTSIRVLPSFRTKIRCAPGG